MYRETEEIEIMKVIFNDPATIVYWSDGSKTVVKASNGDQFNKEAGLALCIMKRLADNDPVKFHRVLNRYIPKE